MFKNTASQQVILFAFDATTNLPVSGDAANITGYVSKDFGAVTALTDTSAAEMNATNAKGFYLVTITQAETNADVLLISGKSSTSNVVVVGAPATIFTIPASWTIPAVTLVNGLASGVITAASIAPDAIGASELAADAVAEIVAGVGALTGDGVALTKVMEMLVAFMSGKVAVSSAAGVSTYSWKKQDGTTQSFTALCSETNGTRATTGSLS